MLNQELIREEYGFLDGEIFLNVSQVCMPPKRVQQAYGSFMDNYVKCFGEGVVDTAWRIVHGCRPKLAQMIHAAHNHEIGFVKNTAEGMGILASGYPLKPGDNVVIADQEHQSTLFPWINAHQTRGIALNIVHHENNEISTEKMIGAIDEHTKVLIVSSAVFHRLYGRSESAWRGMPRARRSFRGGRHSDAGPHRDECAGDVH